MTCWYGARGNILRCHPGIYSRDPEPHARRLSPWIPATSAGMTGKVIAPTNELHVIELSLDTYLYVENYRHMKTEDAIEAFAALAQATRLDVFRLLVTQEPQGLAAGEIATQLGVPHNTMSSHLAILSRAGLISSRRESRSIIYRAELASFQKLALFLLEDCCGGDAIVCAPVVKTLSACCPPKRRKSRA